MHNESIFAIYNPEGVVVAATLKEVDAKELVELIGGHFIRVAFFFADGDEIELTNTTSGT